MIASFFAMDTFDCEPVLGRVSVLDHNKPDQLMLNVLDLAVSCAPSWHNAAMSAKTGPRELRNNP